MLMPQIVYEQFVEGSTLDNINGQNANAGSNFIYGDLEILGLEPFSTVVLVFCVSPESQAGKKVSFAVCGSHNSETNLNQLTSGPSSTNRRLDLKVIPYITSVPPEGIAQVIDDEQKLTITQKVKAFRVHTADIASLGIYAIIEQGAKLDGIYVTKFSS